MIANRLPLITWRWLKVNESLIELPEVKENINEIVANEGDEVSALFDINKIEDQETDSRRTIINIKANKGSTVNIYYVARCSEELSALTDINAEVMEDATVNLIQIEVGAKRSVTNYVVDLIGNKSSTNVESIYFVDEDRDLDIFYHVKHHGEDTRSNILVNGALKDNAKKTFKGTIDFKRGSRLSKGSEEEFATLLDDGVRNIAVPLLLCEEDDVEGLHAASAGQIDQDMLFYIMSRGMDLEQAKKMVVETKLVPTIDKLPDRELSEEVWKQIEQRI
ncbi:SufB/SufD family protein [Peptostreptococcus faecalis]|uniref:SufB/SufD family protein n=1 Tax=Peptostreptococcus faecalis TaxID=2045015 RepID=UPI000C7A43FF|nr:SufD family Fe-S cluster assembly protein [Peptostreptococcus faecalis]